MHVLVIGYGKIGQIKALLWKSLGVTVYVHDVSQPVVHKAVNDGFKSYKECLTGKKLTIDISTPAEQHYNSLKWAIETISSSIDQILIEKPLASSLEELANFTSLEENLKSKLTLNESYFSSAGLLQLMNSIDETPLHIEIELSKNRLDDVAHGRFFDHSLGAVGIETPHMLAILQMLHIPLNKISVSYASLYVDSRQIENQGFEMSFMTAGTSVLLRSFLGDFTRSESRLIKSNRTIRYVKVRTKLNDYVLEFDPAPDLQRYHSRLTMRQSGKTKSTVSEFTDNHLKEHMLHLQNEDPVNPLLSFDNAVYLSSLLNKFRDSFNYTKIDSQLMETRPALITRKGLQKCQLN